MIERALPLGLALAFDLGIGELPATGHPVVVSGWVIGRLAGRPTGRNGRDLARGTLAVALPTAGAWAIGRLVERRGRGVVRFAVAAWLLKSSFALRGLLDAGTRVAQALGNNDLDEARRQLPWLVSRPVEDLDRAHVCSAAIESLAENLADSYVAPLVAYAVGGLPAAMAYRVVNTADAMLGYRGELEFLGKAAARLDDLVNLVPARLTAAAIAVSAPVVGLSGRGALLTAMGDAGRTSSPNAGWSMAAAAGAIGIWLEKPGTYRLGEGAVPDVAHVAAARRLVFAAAALATAAYITWEVSR
ncbi:MAG TPA: adenosylcobinamide-phosphate synthase CbiB [Candidatus Eisenbacteria bacterium]|nr:adenosylcobinamide-phosphate synthase CbiB [Candidatus Eisenbacteria bacterium]